MATIVGLACDDGALLAGDRLLVAGGSVRSTSKRHVFDFGDVGAAAVGPGDAVDRFGALLEAELREYRTERGDPDVEAVARLASDVAADVGVQALVVARDADDEGASVRAVDDEGAVTADEVAAFGSGAALALGHLEAAGDDLRLREAERLVESTFAAVTERDPGTGASFDTYVRRD